MTLNKVLNTGNGMTISEILSDVDHSIIIGDYEYTAIVDRSYDMVSELQSEKSEIGLECSDHTYIAPMSINYKIVVSKINITEFDKLMQLYLNKVVTTLVCGICNLSACIISSLSITDNSSDTITLAITIDEIQFGMVTSISETDSRFQLLYDKSLGNNNTTLLVTSDDVLTTVDADSTNYRSYLDLTSTQFVGIISEKTPIQGSGSTVLVNNNNFGYISYLREETETGENIEFDSNVTTANHIDDITILYS